VLDAGTGIRPLGLSLTEEFKQKALNITLLITHTHWDHIQGFPFFKPAYDPRNQVRILGYEGARASLASTLAGQMESPYFPISLQQMPGNLKIEELREMTFHVGKVYVTTCFSKHPGVCVGYRLHTAAGSIVYLPDNEWSDAETEASQVEPCTQENVLLDFIRGADVVILDAQYDRDEYDTHKGWGHGCVDEVVRLAQMGDVKRLFLFHHDPEHNDEFVHKLVEKARELARAGGTPLQVDAAREGERIVLKAPKAAG
jgi:phosphoribosyl 1,2-cyclic phosphodiesterase